MAKRNAIVGAVVLALGLVGSSALSATVQQNIFPAPRHLLPEALRLPPDTALELVERAMRDRLAADGNDAAAWHALGSVLFAAGQEAHAAEAWNKAHALDDAFAPAPVMAAIRPVFDLQDGGDRAGAVQALAAAERQFGSDPHFLMMRGEQAMRGGDSEAALGVYRRAREADPALYAAALNLARVLDYRGETEAARALYEEAVLLAPERSGPLDFLAQFQFRAGDVQSAAATLRQAETLDVRQPLAEVRLAELATTARDLPGARHWYRAALDRAEAGQNAIRVALSDVLLRLDLIEEARSMLDAVLAEERLTPVLVARGYVDERLGDLDAAARHYREAVAADPGSLPASNNLAMVLIKLGRNTEEALAHASYAVERLPENAAVVGTHALALWHAGETVEALSALQRAVRVDPLDPWLRLALGQVLAQSGQVDAARMQGEACLVLDAAFPRRADCEALIVLH